MVQSSGVLARNVMGSVTMLITTNVYSNMSYQLYLETHSVSVSTSATSHHGRNAFSASLCPRIALKYFRTQKKTVDSSNYLAEVAG